MEAPEFRRRPDRALTVPFFALGLLGFVLLGAGLALAPGALRWPLPPHGVLLLHLAVLGWITPVMIGADYQLIPVVLHRSLPRPGLGRVVLGLYAPGVAIFLAGWGLGHPPLIAAGGAVAGLALLLFTAHAGTAICSSKPGGPVALGLGGGLAFLALTAVLGPWMALSIGGALPAPHFRSLLALHAIAGLSGWLLLTVMGATQQLLPFFAATPAQVRPRFGAAAPILALGGAALLLLGRLLPLGWAGVSLLVLAVAAWLYDLGLLARHGRQARREPAVAATLAAAAALAVGGVGGMTAWTLHRTGLGLAGAAMAVQVGPSLLIAGQLQKVLPFLAALEAASAARRHGAVPKTEALFPRRRAFALLGGLALGGSLEVAGLAAGAPLLVRVGGLLLLAAATAYAWQAGRSLRVWAAARRT